VNGPDGAVTTGRARRSRSWEQRSPEAL